MKIQFIFHAKWMMTALILVSILAGCSGLGNAPTTAAATEQPSTSVPAVVVEATPTPEQGHVPDQAPSQVPVTGGDVLYRDDFTKKDTGWPEAKFDNYFIGYHEPEYYHMEIDSPNSRTTAFIPEKTSYADFTLQVDVLTNSTKTAASGDFIYGPIFRRSGDQYYAFAISPRTKKWFVIKSSPNALTTLAEGTEASIHDLDVDDALRVDVQGSIFYLHINGRLVGQVEDSEYASGEVGFYVQSFDSPQTHIHFDTLTVWDYDAPSLCTILSISMKLNVRSGPGTTFSSTSSLSEGDLVEPIGRSPDGKWIKINLQGSGEQGWIANSSQFVSCNMDVSLLPVITQ